MTSASASRVTRSSRNLRLALLLFGSMLAVVGVLRAQEQQTPAPERKEAAENTEGAEAARGEAAQKPAAAEPDAAEKAPLPKGPSPSRFEPTEKVRADFDVSFPIDI